MNQAQALLSGRYELLRPLAEGGMAQLWLGKLVGTAGFAKLVAVKRILPNLARSRRFADMFLDEGRIAADLRHPNVVQVLEAGADGEELFIAMELLEGLDAGRLLSRALVRGERLPLGVAVQIALDGAAGLAYAHAKSSLDGEPLEIVHRDVSPQNLFVTVDGHTKVVDFGIAKARSQTTLTEAGTLKGKCAYMAPEQVCGDPVDHRADQFALGVVLWELVTGQRLFRRENDIETLRAVLECKVTKPSDVVAGVPKLLDHIALKALAVDPDDRYPSCDELAAALDEFLFTPIETAAGGTLLRGGARGVARIVRERMHDPVAEPAQSQEKTLPERVFLMNTGLDQEVTSAERDIAFIEPPPALPPAPPVLGRDDEKSAVRRAFASGVGLVTLLGPSGAGKSHLARVIADEAGGAVIVALDGAESGADVVTLFAFALGLPSDALPMELERAAAIAGRALSARAKGALVVLDGIDDIPAAAAPLARTLAGFVRVLATARAPLGVMGERTVDVGPLALPAPDASIAEIRQSPAVRLLVDVAGGTRAVAFASPGGVADDWQALAEVARGAGGLPSSLLLAGRWLVERRARPLVAEIERRTGERALSVLLEGGMQHLSDDDRSALVRLAPHRGPLEPSLVDVLVPERAPDEVLAALRAAGAVVGDEVVPAVRERALDELAARGTLADARARHAEALAARALRALSAKDGTAELARMRPAVEDAVEVLMQRGASDGDVDAEIARETAVLVLALALDAGSGRRATPPAHLRILDEALSRASHRADRKLRARALEARGDHAKLAGRVPAARRDYLLALDLVDDDAALTALLHRNIADLDLDAGDMLSADVHARRSIASARRAGDPRAMAKATWTLGRIALKRGNVAEAELLLERAAAAFAEEGEARFAGRTLFELGRCAEARGDVDGARALFGKALAAHEACGDVAFMERARIHLGVGAAWLGKADDARALLEAARDSARSRGDTKAEAAVLAHLADLDAAAGNAAAAHALRSEAEGLRSLSR